MEIAFKIFVLCKQLPDFAILVVNVYDRGGGAIDDPYGVINEAGSGIRGNTMLHFVPP